MKFMATATLLLVSLSATPAGATGATTFTGSCILRGVDVFDPVLTLRPAATTADAHVTGSCNGTVKRPDGTVTKLTGAAAQLDLHTTSASLSCAGGALRGTATLNVDGTSFAMTVTEPQVTAASALAIKGATTGSAQGFAYADQRTDYIGTVQDCLGAGVPSVPITLSLITLTPIG